MGKIDELGNCDSDEFFLIENANILAFNVSRSG
jgi:hypothetical protein